MQVALGLQAHSGWAALVVAAERQGELVLVDRRRIELAAEPWAKQPYHAAEHLRPEAARELVERGVAAAHASARREVRAAVQRERARGNQVVAGAVLVGEPMPAWSTAEILAVHFRMHKAEGVLFRDALVRALEACRLRAVAIPAQHLAPHAERALSLSAGALARRIKELGKSVGPPFGRDQKDAALAAWVALRGGALSS